MVKMESASGLLCALYGTRLWLHVLALGPTRRVGHMRPRRERREIPFCAWSLLPTDGLLCFRPFSAHMLRCGISIGSLSELTTIFVSPPCVPQARFASSTT